jgi:tRNA (uracil-5-)-methyltransferase TRM9
MKAVTLDQLNCINQEFYQKFADSFAQTRRKIQPGVSSILENITKKGNWLDIGCGNGTLACSWAKKGYTGLYLGLDFSPGLIAEAEKNALPLREEQKIVFHQKDLTQGEWANSLPDVEWDGIFCFAVLHHIPGEARRKMLCAQMRKLLAVGKDCYISVWQPRSSPRLVKRIQPWESVGIDPSDVDPGDVLMDWRAHQTHGQDEPAFRYVHIFTEDELTRVARESGFSVADSTYSDGKEGNLGLYQHWVAKL